MNSQEVEHGPVSSLSEQLLNTIYYYLVLYTFLGTSIIAHWFSTFFIIFLLIIKQTLRYAG